MLLAIIAVAAVAGGYFLLARRRVDFATVAYGGALFYFSPVFVGRVLYLERGQDPTIRPEMYLIAGATFCAIVAAGLISDRFQSGRPNSRPHLDLTPCFLALSVGGLIVAFATSGFLTFNFDKTVTIKEAGNGYLLFQVCAALAGTSAVAHKRWWLAGASAALLALDLINGFRTFSLLAYIAACVVMLRENGPVRLFAKGPSYGLATVVFSLVLLFTHTIRYNLSQTFAPQTAAVEFHNRLDAAPVPHQELRTDPRPEAFQATPTPTPAPVTAGYAERLWYWLDLVPYVFARSEQFATQAILNEAIGKNLQCRPWPDLSNLIIIPGTGRWIGAQVTYFADEYMPQLFPGVTYSIASNFWAEALCRGGWAGLAISIVAFGAVLICFTALLSHDRYLTATTAFAGTMFAFYVHRNDTQIILGMLRHVLVATALALLLHWVAARPGRGRWHAQV